MTANQINYWSLQETKRSNLAREEETNRSNLAKEKETNRSNLASEFETNRHNLVSEGIGQQQANAASLNAQVNYMNVQELSRHNNAMEGLQSHSNAIAQQNANTAAYNAETSRIDSKTRQREATTAYLNYLITKDQSQSKKVGNYAKGLSDVSNAVKNAATVVGSVLYGTIAGTASQIGK